MYSITLNEIYRVLAEEQAKRHFDEFAFVKSADNFEEIWERKVAVGIDSFDDFVGVSSPFKDYNKKKSLPNRIAILVDTVGIDGNFTFFYLHQSETESVEDFILSLTAEQREKCYVINKGNLEYFKVVDEKVVYEDMKARRKIEQELKDLRRIIAEKEAELNIIRKRVAKLTEKLNKLRL